MPTLRIPIGRDQKAGRITPEVLAAYRLVLKLFDDPNWDVWEEDGGVKDAFLDARIELDRLLGRKPWEASVTDTFGYDDEPPEYVLRDKHKIADWKKKQELRIELDKQCQ
jgi:hypothetical protein